MTKDDLLWGLGLLFIGAVALGEVVNAWRPPNQHVASADEQARRTVRTLGLMSGAWRWHFIKKGDREGTIR